MKLLKYPFRLLLVLAIIAYSPTSLGQRTLNTIVLHNAEPELLVRAIKPQLSTGSTVSRYQNQLIINATAIEMAKIRQLVQQLDGSGQQLIFSLRREGNTEGSSREATIEGSVGNDDIRISSGPGGIRTETRTSVTVQNRAYTGSTMGNQGIRATEGSPAYIASGSSLLIRQYKTGSDGKISQLSQPADISSGFYATAWIDQDYVTVDIDQRDNQYQQGSISTQQLQTRVSGKLGTWIPIGVVLENQQFGSRSLNTRSGASDGDFTRLFLKIDLAN